MKEMASVGDVVAFDGEVVAHGGEGDEGAGVHAVIGVATDLGDGADDFEADAVEDDVGAGGGLCSEEVLAGLVAEDDDFAVLVEVGLVEPASGSPGGDCGPGGS